MTDLTKLVKVRGLIWRAYNEIGHGRAHYGSGVFGHWYAVSRLDRNKWVCMTHIEGKNVQVGIFPTLEAAQAAAQTDYTSRIHDALESTELQRQIDRIAALTAERDALALQVQRARDDALEEAGGSARPLVQEIRND
jgi:hypothetical protein